MKNILYLFYFTVIMMSSCNLDKEGSLRNVKNEIGLIKGLQDVKYLFKNNQSRMDIKLTRLEKLKLLKEFYFLSYEDFSKKYLHSGKISFELSDFYKANSNYIYFMQDRKAIYAYFIICLSKEKNEMIYCENYTD